MSFTVTTSIIATLIASFMFALWYQSLKHLGNYPLAGFVFWLYISSFITVCIAVLLLKNSDIPNGILNELFGKVPMALGVVLGGICMTTGLIVSLNHMHANGMVANQAISGSIGSILGLIVNFAVDGLPPTVSIAMVVIAATTLILASGIIQHSSVLKYADSGIDITELTLESTQGKPDSLLKQNLVLILGNLLSIGYSIAFMLGTRSERRPNGFPALLCVLLLATGSLIAAVTYALTWTAKHKQWKQVFLPQNKLPILLGIGAGLCHYGGTILQIYSLPLLSAPVSALLTKTSSLWTYLWGIVYGEYKGASIKAKKWLACGIIIFILGIIILTYSLYY